MVTVLMVEDEPIIRNLVSQELTDAGFDVVVAGNADEAVVVLEARNDIRLVFADIDMPGSMDGLRLAAAVRDGTVRNLVCRAIVAPQEADYGDQEGHTGMSRAVLKFARQASLFEQATRPWLAVQDLG